MIYTLADQEPSCFDCYFKNIQTVPIRSVVPMTHVYNIKSSVCKINSKEVLAYQRFPDYFGISRSNCILFQIFIVIELKIKIQDRYLCFSNSFPCAFKTQALMYLRLS